MTDRFKVGDKVVVVEEYRGFPIGHEFIIRRCEGDGMPCGSEPGRESEDYWLWLDDDCLELSSVYHSPLYKALS